MNNAFPPVDLDGVVRQVLSESPDMMVVSFKFQKDAEGALHSHPHTQSTYVKSGRFEFYMGEQTLQIGPGDSFIIPGGMEHGCRCLEAGELIDGFTPRRDDFL